MRSAPYFKNAAKLYVSAKGMVIDMTIKGFFKSCAKALLYFAIYFGWQLIVVNWTSMAASVQVTSTYDPAAFSPENYETLMLEINDRVYDIIMRYSLHLTLLSGILTLLTYFIVFKARHKQPLAEAGLTKLPIGQLPVLIALGAALNIFISLAITLIPFPADWVESYSESSSVLTESGILITLVTSVIAAPLVEEITFRGLIYSRLKQGMPMFAAMIISAWVFGMMHGTVIWFLYAALIGLLLSWIYEKYHSLTASVLVHFSFNLFGSLMELIGGMSDVAFLLMLTASGIASVALLIFIQRNSPHKIEFSFAGNSGDQNNLLQ